MEIMEENIPLDTAALRVNYMRDCLYSPVLCPAKIEQ